MGDSPKLKPQKVVEILDTSFRLYRENFATFLGILAGAYVPIILLSMATTGMLADNALTKAMAAGEELDPAQVRTATTKFAVLNLATGILTMLAQSLATGALTRAVASRYLNEPASIGSCYRYMLGILIKYVLTNLLYGLVIVLGLFLCVIPGLIFLVWFVFTSPVVVLEGLGGTAAMGRSRQLARGNAGRIIGMGLIIFVVWFVFHLGIGKVASFVLPRVTENLVWRSVLGESVAQVAWMILSPIFSVSVILLYYDIRIRKEAFDLEVLAKSMARRGAPAP